MIYNDTSFYLCDSDTVQGPFVTVAAALAKKTAKFNVFAGAELNAVAMIGMSESPIHTAMPMNVSPRVGNMQAGKPAIVMGSRIVDGAPVIYKLTLDQDNDRKLIAASYKSKDTGGKDWVDCSEEDLADIEAAMKSGEITPVNGNGTLQAAPVAAPVVSATASIGDYTHADIEAIRAAEAKGKDKARSALLSQLMSGFSGDLGKAAANAFVAGDVDRFMEAFNSVGAVMKEAMLKKGKGADSESSESDAFSAEASAAWFNNLSQAERIAYLKKHPHSSFSKKIGAGGQHQGASGSSGPTVRTDNNIRFATPGLASKRLDYLKGAATKDGFVVSREQAGKKIHMTHPKTGAKVTMELHPPASKGGQHRITSTLHTPMYDKQGNDQWK